jgi:hypothetical protein
VSVVTNLILSIPCGEDEEQRIPEVNAFFDGSESGRRRPLARLHDSEWRYGGTKYMEAELLMGAFNYFDLPAFMAHLRGIVWEYPEEVQVIVMEQDDAVWRILTLEKAP